MSLHSETAIGELTTIADELRETFAERGHRIGTALAQDASFQAGEDPHSTLARALAKAGIRTGAAKSGSIGLRTLPGGAREIQLIDGNVDRRYRVRRAKVRDDGTYLIEVKDDSVLRLEGNTMFREERWVYSFTLNDDDLIADVFVAEALDYADGSPGHLILGDPVYLGAGLPPTRGFTPTSEDLDVYDEDEDEDDMESDLG